MTRIISFLTLLITFIMISCSAPQPLAEAEKTIADQQAADPERPIPYPVDVPGSFLNAIDSGTRTASGEPGEAYWQNSSEYLLSAELIPDENILEGAAEISYINNSPDDLDRIVIELAQNLHKEGVPKKESAEITGGVRLGTVAVNGSELGEINLFQRFARGESGYIVEGTSLYLFPEMPLTSGSVADISIEWSFTIPEAGASGRMGRNRGNLYFLAYWYPKVAVYDDVYGWLDDSFLGNAEFYHGFANYNLSITAPEGWVVMGTGEFLNPEETLSGTAHERYIRAGNSDDPVTIIGEDEFENATKSSDNGKLTWNFSAQDVRDVAFSATRKSIWESARTAVGDPDNDGSEDYTRIHSFYRSFAPLWRDQVEYAQHSITFLSDFIGIDYPWPHMTSVEGAGIISGGMEFPMMTIIGSYNGRSAADLYGVTAHELAHMWFPMILSTNERRYTWIDEGFTTFHTHQAEMDFYPDRYDNMNMYGDYLSIAGTELEGPIMRWSDYHYPGPAYGVASYPKPASVFTALENVLGKEQFRRAYDELIERWQYKHPYPWDIFNTFEDVTGRDLSWFWRSWFYETWTLDHAIADVKIENGRAVITIEDLGRVVMPVQIVVKLSDGSEIKKTFSAEEWLKGVNEIVYAVETGGEVIEIEINPGLIYPEVNYNNNLWKKTESR